MGYFILVIVQTVVLPIASGIIELVTNNYLQIKLAGRAGFLLLLYIIPIVVALGVARAFGKGPFYGFFLLFLFQPIGYLMLGFGSAQYTEIRRYAGT